MRDVHQHLAASVDRTLAEQARQNELRIGYIRVLVWTITTCSYAWMHLRPPEFLGHFPLANVILAGVSTAVFIAIAFAFRQGYWDSRLPLVMPVVDAASIIAAGHVFWDSGVPPAYDYSGVVAVLLAGVGGLRFRRDAIAVSLATALTVFFYLQWRAERPVEWVPLVGAVIVGAGLMAFWINAMVRRAVTAEVAKSTLSRFLPESVIEGAHTDPLSLVAEPRVADVAILISDLRGFTRRAESMTPTETMAFLNDIQGEFAEQVWTAGGMVDKFMGDGMLAVFGVLDGTDPPARQAFEAAAAMLASLLEVNARYASAGRAPVEVGIGIHAGPTVIGCLGSGAHLELTVVGDAVNTASRLESLTKQHDTPILASARAVELAGGPSGLPAQLTAVPRGRVPIRGRDETLEVYGLTLAG